MERMIMDAAVKSIQAVDSVMRKAWSVLDAATPKETPAQALSPQAIASIQGVTKPGGA